MFSSLYVLMFFLQIALVPIALPLLNREETGLIESLKTKQTPRVFRSYLQLNDFSGSSVLVSYCLGMKLCDSDKRIESA